MLGATDPRLRAVVAQVPTISGAEQTRRRVAPEAVAGFVTGLIDDERARARGEAMARRAIVSDDPAVPASYRAPDAVAFYLQDVPEGVWTNEVTVRSTFAATTYEPGVFVDRVSPTPLLMVVATHDTITLTDTALAAYERALEPKRLVTIPGGHFDPYLAGFADGERGGPCVVRRPPAAEGVTMSEMSHVSVTTKDGVATLVLHNPPQNRIGTTMVDELDARPRRDRGRRRAARCCPARRGPGLQLRRRHRALAGLGPPRDAAPTSSTSSRRSTGSNGCRSRRSPRSRDCASAAASSSPCGRT